jgi:hypothetical protein
MSDLTANRVRELFNYDPKTGVLTRKIRSGRKTRVGQIVGFLQNYGYLMVGIDYREYLVHRVIFLWFHGRWPHSQIDHINHNRTDNRIENLREATHRENGVNQKLSKNNTSGHNGVYWNKQVKKWQAYITVEGKARYLGIFEDIKDAISARKRADIKHEFHENHGSK